MYVPGKQEIEAKALELGVDLTERGARARVARVISEARAQAERDAAAPPEPPKAELVSRTQHRVDGGRIVVDVLFIPNDPKHGEDRDHDREHQQDGSADRG